MKYIIFLGVLLLAACSGFSYLVSPTYPPPKCGYRDVICGDGTCCPESHRCEPDRCVFDPTIDNPWVRSAQTTDASDH